MTAAVLFAALWIAHPTSYRILAGNYMAWIGSWGMAGWSTAGQHYFCWGGHSR